MKKGIQYKQVEEKTGEQRLKEIFKKARENYIPSDVRGFAEVVNRYWGIEKLYSRNKIWTLEKPDGVIQPKDIYYLAPFTPYTEKQLKAIANNEEIPLQIGEKVKTDKLDIVEEIKTVLSEKQLFSEQLAQYAYIQKSRLNRIIHRDSRR
ncbi:MAG: hypothetical protein SAL07_18880 [Oscillatoria sp. PMC 1051.18]|nr:hypothetical protein [Oscillatoria sp. PMC 1050.18]MEC5031968.1 hypothetical protein [Oscillatoria sp. PMC 1051.18]